MGKDESQRAAGANCGCKSRASSVRWKQPQLVRWQRTLLLLRCRRSPDMRRSGGVRREEGKHCLRRNMVSTKPSFLHLSPLSLSVHVFRLLYIWTDSGSCQFGSQSLLAAVQCGLLACRCWSTYCPSKEFQMNFAKAHEGTAEPENASNATLQITWQVEPPWWLIG